MKGCTLIATLLLVVLINLQAAVAADRHALILTGELKSVDKRLIEQLGSAGIGVVVRPFAQPVSMQMLRLFEVVIVPDFAGLKTPHFVPHSQLLGYLNAERNVQLLHEYVAAGGGLFFAPLMTGGGEEVAEGCNLVLAPWDAQIMAFQVRDDAHAGIDGQYAWTTNIPRTAVTEGVERIWYPTNMLRWDDAYSTMPILVGEAWQPTVLGMPESAAARGWQYTNWRRMEEHRAPVISAVLQAGKGRVAILGMAGFFTFNQPYASPRGGWIGESKTGIIDGIFMEKGDGEQGSDGFRLLVSTLKWLGATAQKAGLGGYTEEALAALPALESASIPAWVTGWNEANGGLPQKTLIGARSRYSSGTGEIAAWATAAREAGCNILVMTERFEAMRAEEWADFVRDCDAASSAELVVMPGIDIADVYENRYLILGQRIFPAPFMLSPDGRRLKEAQYLSLGFGTHFTAVHRPTTSPLPHHLYKFFSGSVVYTYQNGKIVDDGRPAYEWMVYNISNPIPLVVHEMESPEQVSEAATTGHQLYVLADTPANAAWYMRAGMQHFWESPSLFLVTSGPMISVLRSGQIKARSEAPIREVTLRTNYYPERRWLPNANEIDLSYQLPPSHQQWSIIEVVDAKGGSALTPGLRSGPAPRYCWRCSDRQNFFGYAMNYTGTRLPDVDPRLDVWGTDEGKGLWPHGGSERRGENLAPLLDFPFASHAVTITDAWVDQRYWRANWLDVAYDGKASQGTSRSRVYQAQVRYFDFGLSETWRKDDQARPMMIKQIELRLRRPVSPSGELFAGFTRAARHPSWSYVDRESGEVVEGQLTSGHLDLPFGAQVGNFVALCEGLRLDAGGQIGWSADHANGGPLPVGAAWTARWVRLPEEGGETILRAMGLRGETPYTLALSRGHLERIAYVAEVDAAERVVTGTIEPAAEMPYPLPLWVRGLHAHWPAAIVQSDGELQDIAVFEGVGYGKLDATRGGSFFAGNTLVAGHGALRLAIRAWTESEITVEAHNPTGQAIETRIVTPTAIPGRFQLDTTLAIPAGTTIIQSYKAP